MGWESGDVAVSRRPATGGEAPGLNQSLACGCRVAERVQTRLTAAFTEELSLAPRF
jgi:hypothetical protein